MQKPKPINWIAVRAEYEAGGIGLRQLAQKIGVSRSTIERRSSKEGWHENKGAVKAEVKAAISAKVHNNIVEQRVNQGLSDLEIIDSVIASTYKAIKDAPDYFKTTGEAVAALDKMFKIKLEYSDEHIQKWLLDKGYVAVPIAEFAPSIENSESSNIQGAFADILREDTDTASPIATSDQQ